MDRMNTSKRPLEIDPTENLSKHFKKMKLEENKITKEYPSAGIEHINPNFGKDMIKFLEETLPLKIDNLNLAGTQKTSKQRYQELDDHKKALEDIKEYQNYRDFKDYTNAQRVWNRITKENNPCIQEMVNITNQKAFEMSKPPIEQRNKIPSISPGFTGITLGMLQKAQEDLRKLIDPKSDITNNEKLAFIAIKTYITRYSKVFTIDGSFPSTSQINDTPSTSQINDTPSTSQINDTPSTSQIEEIKLKAKDPSAKEIFRAVNAWNNMRDQNNNPILKKTIQCLESEGFLNIFKMKENLREHGKDIMDTIRGSEAS